MGAQSIAAKKGRLFLIKLGDGNSPPTYTTLGGLRATDMTLNNAGVDITNKGSNGWRELLPDGGIQNVTLTGSGLFDANSAQQKQLKNAFFNRVLLQAEIVDENADRVYGYFHVSSYKESGAHNDAQMYDATLESSGAIAALIN